MKKKLNVLNIITVLLLISIKSYSQSNFEKKTENKIEKITAINDLTRIMSSTDPNLDPNWNWWDNSSTNNNGQVTIYYKTPSQPGSTNSINVTLPFFQNTDPASVEFINNRDFYPEHGWVLLYRDFGISTEGATLPCFFLYNKYRGILRMFYLNTFINNSFTYAMAKLEFDPNAPSVSGLLTLSDPSNNTLDNLPNPQQISIHRLSSSFGTWAFAEFDVRGYDPNVVNFQNSTFRFSVLGVNESTLNLSGTITLDFLLKDQAYSINTEVSDVDKLGKIVNGIPGAVLSYQKGIKSVAQLEGYLTQASAYVSWLTPSLIASIVSGLNYPAAAIAVISGLADLFSSGGGSSTAPSDLTNSLLQLKLDGTIHLNGQITLPQFINVLAIRVPGAIHPTNNSNLKGYPIYNKPLGLFNLTELPKVNGTRLINVIDYKVGKFDLASFNNGNCSTCGSGADPYGAAWAQYGDERILGRGLQYLLNPESGMYIESIEMVYNNLDMSLDPTKFKYSNRYMLETEKITNSYPLEMYYDNAFGYVYIVNEAQPIGNEPGYHYLKSGYYVKTYSSVINRSSNNDCTLKITLLPKDKLVKITPLVIYKSFSPNYTWSDKLTRTNDPASLGSVISDITSNTTLTGSYKITQNIIISNNSTLTLSAGSSLAIESGVSITVQSGSKIISNGTKQNPVIITSASKDTKYDRITLFGDNNSFNWTRFENGNIGVLVQSNGNVFSNCKFKNNSYGLSSTWNSASSKSGATIDNCIMSNNIIGLTIKNAFFDVKNSSIFDNTATGIYMDNGTSYSFYNNLIENNRTDNSQPVYGGIYMINNSVLYLAKDASYYLSNYSTTIPTAGAGLNRIQNNKKHEIYLASTNSRIYVGVLSSGSNLMGGYNKIADTDNGSAATDSRYIYNSALTQVGDSWISWPVNASMTYWNTSGGSPAPSSFYGSVVTNYNLTSDPTYNSGANLDVYNQMSYSISSINDLSGPKPLMTAETISALREREVQLNAMEGSTIEFSDKMNQFTYKYSNKIFDGTEITTLNSMFDLANTQKKSLKKENTELVNLIDFLKNDSGLEKSKEKEEQLLYEFALLLKIRSDFNSDNWINLESELIEDWSKIKNKDNKLSLLLNTYSFYERKGDYQKALKTINEIEKISPDDDVIDGGFVNSYELLKNTLLKTFSNNGKVDNEEFSKNSVKEIPTEYSISQNYPNPFNPVTNISFKLPKESHVKVEVYNLNGQLISTLADRQFGAGEQMIQFDASHVTSGTYLYKVTMNGKTYSKKMTVIK